jgi:putative nucleotidyltransferase with HDIG domain
VSMLFFRKKSKKEQSIEIRHKRLRGIVSGEKKLCEKLRIVFYGCTFLLAVIFISFWKQIPIGPQLFLNHIAKVSITSVIDFEYESDLKTKTLREQRRQMVTPVYKIDLEKFHQFCQRIEILKARLNKISTLTNAQEKPSALDSLVESFDSKYNIVLQPEDLNTLLQISTVLQRNRLIEEGIFVLQEIVQKGILDDNEFGHQVNADSYVSVSQKDDSLVHLQTKGNALRFLRMSLFVMDVEYDVANALMHVLKFGLVPNVIYDQQKTEDKIDQFVAKTPNVLVRVRKGEPIVDSGQVVTPEVYECFVAYQDKLVQTESYQLGFNAMMTKKVFLVCLLYVCTVLSLQLLPTKIKKSSRYLWITAFILLLNIVLIRGTSLLCYHVFGSDKLLFFALVPFLPPTFLASLLIAPLVDMLGGFMCTFFIVSLKNFIIYLGLEYFFLDLLIGLLIVYLCRKIYLKKDLARHCLVSYSLLALLTVFYSLSAQHLGWLICCQQVSAIFVNCFVTLLLVMCLLPICERNFGCATNITFLELTDYNHPLLRRLQMLAPGTYHHSLMVATLAEKVANEIGANSLLCRCCALYHDIGKLVKPEYFTENQKEGENPHEHQPPSMSAVILKSHVKEGIELAKSYNLPKVVIDVIQQHHGNTIMQYFYKKALRLQETNGEPVDPLIFRYDGPKPQFKESAIISLADAVEAASRSLVRVSAQAIAELIDDIVKERIHAEQFNECSVTLQEIDQLKKSFQFTLLNMLHARVGYNENGGTPDNEKKKDVAPNIAADSQA